jgi:transposase
MEWARVGALAADGVSEREIAARLGINRRMVARLAAAEEPPRYSRASVGPMLDPLEPMMRRVLAEWPEIKAPRMTEILREDYGYVGSVDLVKRRLAKLRPTPARSAQRTGYRPGQVMQVDWAEMPTRPRIAGRERRVYALVCALPYSGASTARFSFEMTVESFLEGHVSAFSWLGGVPRECVCDNLCAAPPGTPGRQPALRADRAPLRTRLDHRHQQPRLRSLGRNPLRRHGRRRAHRPARPPRPHRHPQGQELSPAL